MKGLSKKEMEIVSNLEFTKLYFFTREHITKFFSNKIQERHIIHKLMQKGRIVSLNRNKYYLIPVKARTGKWTENPFIIADEIFNGDDYFVGGWAAANYWRLTDQIPMQTDVWTTKRQGKKNILGVRFSFHRTTRKRIVESVTEHIADHPFKIVKKQESKKWLKSRK